MFSSLYLNRAYRTPNIVFTIALLSCQNNESHPRHTDRNASVKKIRYILHKGYFVIHNLFLKSKKSKCRINLLFDPTVSAFFQNELCFPSPSSLPLEDIKICLEYVPVAGVLEI